MERPLGIREQRPQCRENTHVHLWATSAPGGWWSQGKQECIWVGVGRGEEAETGALMRGQGLSSVTAIPVGQAGEESPGDLFSCRGAVNKCWGC